MKTKSGLQLSVFGIRYSILLTFHRLTVDNTIKQNSYKAAVFQQNSVSHVFYWMQLVYFCIESRGDKEKLRPTLPFYKKHKWNYIIMFLTRLLWFFSFCQLRYLHETSCDNCKAQPSPWNIIKCNWRSWFAFQIIYCTHCICNLGPLLLTQYKPTRYQVNSTLLQFWRVVKN